MVENKSKIDIACGDSKKEGFFGIDIADIPGVDLVHDLNVYPWPIESNSVDEIYCSHYIEHIKHDDSLLEIQTLLKESNSFEEFKEKVMSLDKPLDGFIKFVNEVYRILKPGAKATLVAPYVTHTRSFGDPTHTRYIHDMSFYYLNAQWRQLNRLEHYNINCDFDIRFSYQIDNDLTLKSEEIRKQAFAHDWNSITDIIVELTKR